MNTKKTNRIISTILKVIAWALFSIGILMIPIFFTRSLWMDQIDIFDLIVGNQGQNISIDLSLTTIDPTLFLNAWQPYFYSIILLLTSGGIFYLLSRMFYQIAQGELFVRQNLKSIYFIAGLQILGDIVAGLFIAFETRSLLGQIALPDMVQLNGTIHFNLVPGLIILVIGFFFSQAVKIQEEQALTI